MNRSMLSLFIVVGLGCASGLPTGRAEQAQVDPGMRPWRSVELRFGDQSQLGVVYVIGGRDLGAYEANTEYWFVNRAELSRLGQEPLSLRTIEQYSADPPEPDFGEAVPPTPDLQMFTQPVYPEGGWGSSWQQDPASGGVLLQGGNQALRLLQDEDGISRVVWYQVIDRRSAPANITPSGVFSVVGAVQVPRGYVGYSIDLEAQ